MNERIREFAVAAGGYEVAPHDFLFRQEQIQKFAELIVGECVDIAKHHVMNISTYADADFVDEQIKKHFGVES